MATHAHSTPAPTLQRGPQIAAGGLSARERLTHHPEARRRLEATLERWIAILDEVDGDCDLEEGGDREPSLCLFNRGVLTREDRDDDRELDASEEEPTLGWTEFASQRGYLGLGSDDREPDCDREPEDAA